MMKQTIRHTYSNVKFASKTEMEEMKAIIADENEFQKIEPQGWNDEKWCDEPIVYKLERHSSWQMTAYRLDGTIMDNSYHIGFCRCNNCKHIFEFNNGADASNDNQVCYECNTEFTDGSLFYNKSR